MACEYTSASDRLHVLAGTNSGQFAAFPVLPVCGRQGRDGAEQKRRNDDAGDGMEVEESEEGGEISGWRIGPAVSVFDGKHVDVVRDVLSTGSGSGDKRDGVTRSKVWSCGEDGVVCRWMAEG